MDDWNPNPVECINGKWYWWDEIWVTQFGPYDTKEEAEKECINYCKNLE